MKLAWIDLRGLDEPLAVAEEAAHVGAHGLLSDDPAVLGALPPSVKRVGMAADGGDPAALAEVADVVVVDHRHAPARRDDDSGVFVRVDDHASLDVACDSAGRPGWTLIDFTDPTKIPLEIVLAAADGTQGRTVTLVHDLEEAQIVVGVLERGSDGVLFAPRGVGETTELMSLLQVATPKIDMSPLEVAAITHVGLGDRVCVDTCSHLGPDEGILVGSYAGGMVLVSSETHPLPYMPTRPFRVNAGALHSYTLGPENRTRYLSELGSGSELLAVRTNGETRRVVVGRAKIETRPLLRIEARSASGTAVDLLVQDDWHVRVLGPEAEVRNVTDLKPGDELAGATLTDPRHVGYAVREFLLEK
ncbi:MULTISPECIES: 3-dehydroquinate synthase II family protein [Actinomadura]|uniref:3-dehydroquinate synthase II family protein n=1 Tax=Actinomadura yumaensis TaxID=111807 RepID=A0ABW2CME9_9ACTN|nr:3-dehydroquinate synthase II family protein [Actinomadura sp. J1-007]MWK36848.1 3-dehydroquinate synthase II family protein [Actinomadura sp. J1-007]